MSNFRRAEFLIIRKRIFGKGEFSERKLDKQPQAATIPYRKEKRSLERKMYFGGIK